jgi:tetratricopeptide (TPR) repeat protein
VPQSPSSLSQDSKAWLKAGIAAAKAGQRKQANELLRRVVECDEENVSAWLWLSGVAESPGEREACLQNVLELDPHNAAARKGLAQLHKERVTGLLREGIAAAKAGRRERASDLLTQVVVEDERNVKAWLWLSGVVDEEENRVLCLENVLALDPDNEMAIKGLTQLRREGVSVSTDVEDVPLRVSRTEAEALQDVGDAREDPLGNPYLCPYCAALTQPEDRKCPVCEQKLWFNYRAEESRSLYMWLALALQVLDTLLSSLLPAGIAFILVVSAEHPELLQSFQFAARYYRLEIDSVFSLLYVAFAVSLVPFLLLLLALIGLYLRWKLAFYLLLVSTVINLLWVTMNVLISILGMNPLIGIFGLGYVSAIISFAFSMCRLFLAFMIQDDFAFEEERVMLQLEQGVSSGPMLYSRAQAYAKRRMWALAALHMRRAVMEMPDRVEVRAALILMYIELKRYDLAARVLEEGLRRHPEEPRLLELQESLPTLSGAPV